MLKHYGDKALDKRSDRTSSHISYSGEEMSAENQAGSQRNDHYRDVIALAGAIGAAVKDNRYCQRQEPCA